MLSWEALGLAAAAVLAVALFVPVVMRDGDPVSSPQRFDAVPSEGIEQEELSGLREAPGKGAGDDDDFAPVPPGAPAATRPEPQRARKRADAPQQKVAVPPTAAGRAAPAPAELSADAVMKSSSRYESVPADDPQRVALPRLTAIPRELLVVEDASTWASWLEGPAGDALDALGPPAPGRRLVLVGASGGTHCSAMTVRRTAEAYRVSLGVAEGSDTGCAFVLPSDGLPVVRDDEPPGTSR